jgi:uncharacterized protein YbjT (DUF2867 family)
MSDNTPPSGSPEQVHFVAGATGYTGQAVVAALRRRGHLTWAHVRPDSRGLERWTTFFAEQGAGVDATPWTADAFRETLMRIRPTHVWGLLGTTKARADRDTGSAVPETYEAVDYGLTRLLLDAAVSAGSSPAFVYMSAQGVTERTDNPYLSVRVRLERELRASGLPWAIARPSFVTGGDRLDKRPMERVYAVALDVALGVAAAFGAKGISDRWRSISGPDLGEGLVRLIADRSATGGVLDGRDWWPVLVRTP